MIQRDEYHRLCQKYLALKLDLEKLQKECEKLKAQLSLWKGTAP